MAKVQIREDVKDVKEIDKSENKLFLVEELIDEYFNINPDSHINKILFAIADFGKGKSVFLRHYTSNLTKEYINDPTKYLPIYFNLRNYKDYSEDHFLGAIGLYLERKYGIKINDDYFKKKRYIFFVDSLDESGELNSATINKVIDSIKKIQNIDPIISNKNKIIIATRPFDEGLKMHLQRHDPLVKANDQGRPVEYFISIYGFKRGQFNNWLINSIKKLKDVEDIAAEGLNKKILDAVKTGENYDIYADFLKRNILSAR